MRAMYSSAAAARRGRRTARRRAAAARAMSAGRGGRGGGGGAVVGPASAVDHSVALYSGTSGKVITDASQVTVDAATGTLTTPGSLTAVALQATALQPSH